jgi:hypothetical protein
VLVKLQPLHLVTNDYPPDLLQQIEVAAGLS